MMLRLTVNIQKISGNRKVGFFKQFYYLFKRSFQFNMRNPKGLMAMIGIAILNGLLFSAVFGAVG